MKSALLFTVLVIVLGGFFVSMPAEGHTNISPAASGIVTWMPYGPYLTGLGDSQFTQLSTSNFVGRFAFTNEYNWCGVMIRWDDWGPRDLSSFTSFTFAVRGTPRQLKIEFENTNALKTIAFLQDITNEWQYYQIPAAAITNNLGAIKVISIVATYDLCGAGNYTGVYEVIAQGFNYDWRPASAVSGTPTHLPGLPLVSAVGGANPDTVMVNTNPTLIEIAYNVSNGWSGASILYDNRDTWPMIESCNLLAYNPLTFGLQGDARNVKVEFLDVSNNVMFGFCTNIGPALRYYSFDTGILTNNLSAISAINFVVDSNLVAAGLLKGRLNIVSGGLNYPLAIAGAGAGAPTWLPNYPRITEVGGANPDTQISQRSASEFTVNYNVTSGWSGASILYDDYATIPIETGNLAAFGCLVFGISGTPERVKFEALDNAGHKSVATLTGIGGAVQYFSIGLEHLTNKNVNPAAIASISLIVDSVLAGPGREKGSFTVFSGGHAFPLQIEGQPAGAITLLPPTPVEVALVGGANADTKLYQLSTNRFRVMYNVPAGWSGASILYDDYGSEPVEVGDFAGLSAVTFGIRGDPASLKLEFKDATNKTVDAVILNVSNALQYFTVSVGDMTAKGLDAGRISMINFVVDSNRAGAAQLTGTFEVFTAGLVFRNLIYPQEDQNGDGLDDRWAEAHGLAGDDPDPDRDGVPNDAERIAGTDPNDPASAPILSIHAAGVQAQLTAAGFGQREYRLYRTDNLVTGHWSRVGPALKLSTNGPAVWQELIVGLSNGYYGFSVTHDPVSRLPGRPQVILVGGGETNHTLLNQESASAFTLGYQLTGGYAGVTLLYDDYGTEPREFADFSGYSELSFGISGTARSVKFEFEDAALNKASGAFQFVGGAEQFFTIDLGLIARDGVDLSRISFINFVVDLAAAGSTNPGCVAWRTFGLNYTIEPPPQPTGPATVLREPAPQVIEVGGGNNATGHERFGTTNILVNYDVGAYGTWDGITILYDNYGTEPMESADYSDVESLTIGLAGLPAALKLEFDDTTAGTPAVPVYCRGLATGAVQYFTVRMRDLEAGGLDSGHVRFINVVVDQALAGAGNYTGTFTVATGGLAP